MSNLQVIANEMLPVLENEKGEKFVNARTLHEKLMTTTKFADWIKRRIRQYGFVENEDFFSLLKNEKRVIGGTTSIDYIFTLDSGKELAMVENTEQGRAIRKYFIEVEKQARKLATEYPAFSYMIDDPVARAKKWIEEQQEKQEALKQIEEQKPKVMFAEAVSDARGTILIRDLAKLIQQNGIDIGEKRLFEWMRQRGYLISRKGTDYNRPTQKSMELGLFKIKETAIIRSSGAQTAITAKVTGKGQLYFVNKFLEQSLKTI
ncbi:phage antirepressor KilAC domain-containing protein [Listeria innocua]|uniref:Phage antirepressor Ant n=1 Tax=Listeria monocytogenes TaxID=1639 RepID=A0A462NK62_LISMN|nr:MULTISPECIES: phage antirepressor KilAC domain-containing protein [Listeria]EAC4174387.1 phage antirepressor Ant [Listeria monocytogenes]EAD6056801.1 phage antirepressor Ant [Listeria monocytogenes]EAE2835378.1 phage antirepressor Ant [Listeria monocytogenes]EAE3313633.1 phage antirepressor Ant [Listeria monocytogenes]EAE3459093.1 phage antirepressor Ant [Listeria monocytogenes]